METKKPATKKKTIRKHPGINQRTGKLKKGFKYVGTKIVEVKTKAQKMRQTGTTHTKEDKQKKALKPGKRTSKNGNVYYERRANRSDVGKLLGTKTTKKKPTEKQLAARKKFVENVRSGKYKKK